MASELAKAYVQILPTAEGISGSISKLLDGEAESAGKSAGGKLSSALGSAAKVGAAGVAAAGTAITKLVKDSATAYADYEQLVGGVETLFQDSAGTVQEFAANAFKTAGLSANEYMETVTSFSASLLQSLGGDTEQAAMIGDMAISDMADNANKMGSSMESIQNAYQGFAKQNYTMLDNLKLGYGGTKSEMERLLQDATALSGVEYDIDSLSDVYSAIHVIQDELGITGTTAKEASETISGSLDSMKSAWDNLLVGVADDDADIGALVDNFVESAVTAGENIIPRVEQIVGKLGDMIAMASDRLVPLVVDTIVTNLPAIIESGVTLIASLINGIVQALPKLIEKTPEIIKVIVFTLVKNAPLLLGATAEMFAALMSGIGEWEKPLIMKGREIVEKIKSAITGKIADMRTAGKRLLEGLWNGINDKVAWLKSQVSGVVDKIKGWFTGKSGFDEHSPSKWAEQVGAFISEGLANGIEEEADEAKIAAEKLAKDTYSSLKEWADRTTKYQELSTKEQIGLWSEIQRQFAEGTAQYVEAGDKLFDLRKQQLKEQELAETSFKDSIKSIYSEIDKLEANYQKQLADRSQQIFDSYKLFDKVPERQEKNGEELIDNLSGQIETIERFYSGLEALAGRGVVSDALLDDIRDMGPAAADQLDALLSLSDDRLSSYAGLYEKKQKLANETALKELKNLRDETDKQIRENMVDIAGIIGEATSQSALWGSDLIQNFISGIQGKWNDLKGTVSQTAQSIKNYLGFSEPDMGPLADFHTYAPDMMDLFAKGIRDNISTVTSAAREAAAATRDGMTSAPAAPVQQAQTNAGGGDVVAALLSCTARIVAAIESSGGSVDYNALAGRLWSPMQQQNTIHGGSLVTVTR